MDMDYSVVNPGGGGLRGLNGNAKNTKKNMKLDSDKYNHLSNNG